MRRYPTNEAFGGSENGARIYKPQSSIAKAPSPGTTLEGTIRSNTRTTCIGIEKKGKQIEMNANLYYMKKVTQIFFQMLKMILWIILMLCLSFRGAKNGNEIHSYQNSWFLFEFFYRLPSHVWHQYQNTRQTMKNLYPVWYLLLNVRNSTFWTSKHSPFLMNFP